MEGSRETGIRAGHPGGLAGRFPVGAKGSKAEQDKGGGDDYEHHDRGRQVFPGGIDEEEGEHLHDPPFGSFRFGSGDGLALVTKEFRSQR